MSAPAAIVVMGVAGAGKTAVGRALAAALAYRFVDGDDLHPAENVANMAAGVPLEDADRWPWLTRVAHALHAETTVVACSALKRRYRDHLRAGAGVPVLFVHLAGRPDLLAERLAGRKGHFMPPALLTSQLAALQPPDPDEWAITVAIDPPPARIVAEIIARSAGAGLGRN